MYKKFIVPEYKYYHKYRLNNNKEAEQIIKINPVRQISINQLDKTQNTEKILNEGIIESEE